MSTAFPSHPWLRTVPAALAIVLVAAMLGLTSCGKRRTPEQLLVDPGSRGEPQALARAKELYLRNCAICHGETGKGDGRYFASDLQPTPSDITEKGADALDLDGVKRWIREGSGGFGRSKLCPPWGYTLTTEDTAALARFVLSLRETQPPASGGG